MSEIYGVCFDLGSTLLQFEGEWDQQTIQQGVNQMVHQLGNLAPLDRLSFAEKFARAITESRTTREMDYIERRTRDTLQTVYEEETGQKLSEETLDASMNTLYAVSQQSWGAMPGVQQVLGILRDRGYRLAIISNAADAADVYRLIERFGLQGYFDPILISAEQGRRKPHQQMFDQLLKAWNLPAENVVMVGDTLLADIAGAQQAGMHQIWIQRDRRSHEDPSDHTRIQPEQTASSLLEIPALIRNIGK